MASTIQYEIPTWNQIYDMLLSQAKKIQKTDYTPDIIVAIIRGGLIPARILTDLLEVPQLTTIQIEFYTGIAQTGKKPTLVQTTEIPMDGKKVLLVDDIADTGKSLHLAKTYLQTRGANEIRTATIYYKLQSIVKPNFFEKEALNWIIFPWESNETIKKIIQKHIGKKQNNMEIAKLIKFGFPQDLIDKILTTD